MISNQSILADGPRETRREQNDFSVILADGLCEQNLCRTILMLLSELLCHALLCRDCQHLDQSPGRISLMQGNVQLLQIWT
jgi:hypothetical protein